MIWPPLEPSWRGDSNGGIIIAWATSLLPIDFNTRQNNHETAASLRYARFIRPKLLLLNNSNNNNDTTIQTAISSYSLQLPHYADAAFD